MLAWYTNNMLRQSWSMLLYGSLLLILLFRPVDFVLDEYFAFEIPLIKQIGYISLVSPLPMPFRESQGYENYVMRTNYLLYSNNSPVQEMDERQIYSHLTGPHRHKIVFIGAVNWGRQVPRAWRSAVHQYFFCKHQAVGVINKVEIEFVNQRDGIMLWNPVYRCQF